MEDEFEDQYADELDALDDINGYTSPKPRRSLHFATPKQKGLSQSAPFGDTSLLDIPDSIDGPTALLKDNTKVSRNNSKKREREVNDAFESDGELEYEDDDLNEKAPSSKRSRVDPNQLDEADLWEDNRDTSVVKAKHLYGNHVIRPAEPEVADIVASPDKRIMEKILQHRNRGNVQELNINEAERQHDRFVDKLDIEKPRVFKRIPADRYLPTTGTEGNRVYMKIKEDTELEKDFETMDKSKTSTHLLGVSMASLRERLEEERQTALLAESQRLSDEVHRQLRDDDDDDDDGDEDKENHPPSAEADSVCQRLLWVEKYAPQQYTDLLSEELQDTSAGLLLITMERTSGGTKYPPSPKNINRTLLHWLKLWDYVVFDKEVPAKSKDKKKEEPKKFNKKFQPEVMEELDKLNRPLQKIALLCGPPGLGKTTLAHIIAKHAGYNMVEMNASDDRSAEVFKNKIEASTQMKAVLGADPRPNCLVIDEIDGSPQAAINVLLNLIKRSEMPETGKKKKKEEGGILRRPIICICNDQYVPALRQLRPLALVVNFPQTESAKLASRLYEVVRFERLRADMNALLALCEKTDNDIRSCLNTLQFINQQHREVNLKNIQAMAVGQKDTHKSLFSVWNEVLTLPRPKRQKFVNIQDDSIKDLILNTSPSARFKNVLAVVQGAGEYDKMAQGLFENYLDCKFKDPYMEGVSLATEWLCYTDVTNQYIQHLQDYRLMPYLPFMSVLFHFLFASNQITKLQYPNSMAECNMKRTKCENLMSSMMADMVPGTRKYINFPIVVMEIMPPLMDIIQPSFRPVNTQLYSTKEKEDLANLVRVMISYNLTYQQEKALEGQYSYVLEPHMDEVVKFPGMKQHRQLTYASKQLVAREVQLEKMRRMELSRAPQESLSEVKDKSGGGSKEQPNTPAVPNHLQRLTAKPLGKEEEVQIKDFFGRVLKRTALETKKASSDEPTKTNVLATDIWFHFQEGYSNAVRRNVKVKDFF